MNMPLRFVDVSKSAGWKAYMVKGLAAGDQEK